MLGCPFLVLWIKKEGFCWESCVCVPWHFWVANFFHSRSKTSEVKRQSGKLSPCHCLGPKATLVFISYTMCRYFCFIWWEEQEKEHLFHLPGSQSLLYCCSIVFWWLYFNIICFLCNPMFYSCIYKQYSENHQAHIEVHSTKLPPWGAGNFFLKELQKKWHKIIFQDDTMGPAPFCRNMLALPTIMHPAQPHPGLHGEGKLQASRTITWRGVGVVYSYPRLMLRQWSKPADF